MSTNFNDEALYMTVNDLCKKFTFMTVGGIRHLIFNEKINGFERVIRRVGRKILIHVPAFLEYIDQCKGNKQQTTINGNKT